MPKMRSGVRTSRGKRSKAFDRVASELAVAAEQYGYFQTEEYLSAFRAVADRAARAGMDVRSMTRTTESAVSRGEARREAERAAEAAAALPVEVVAPAPSEKKRTRKRAEPKVPEGPMISSPFYPTQPCGLSYKDFRVGHTYKDAYHWLMTAPREEGTYRTITQRAVLRQLAKMKRQTYEQYLSDCAAQEQYEVEQAHGGREGEYATDDSGDFDLSFDPSEFAPAEPEDFIAFNPRRKRTSRRAMSVEEVWHRLGSPRVNLSELATGIRIESEHGVGPVRAGRIALDHLREFPDYYTRLVKMEERAKRGLAPNPKIVSLGPHAYFAAAGLAMNARRTSRRPRKATSRKNAPR